MSYAAIDIHKQAFQAAVLDPDSAEVIEERFSADRESLARWGGWVAGPGGGGRDRSDDRLGVERQQPHLETARDELAPDPAPAALRHEQRERLLAAAGALRSPFRPPAPSTSRCNPWGRKRPQRCRRENGLLTVWAARAL
jgi:hypothetical protein